MGGASEVLSKAKDSFERGEYRWVAEVVNHVVFADPSNAEARELEAAALEQMGYQTESSTWRNAFLTAAQELRIGTLSLPFKGTASADSIRALDLAMLLNFWAVRLNGPRAAGHELTLNLTLTDTSQEVVLRLSNATLSHSLERRDPDASATITTTREALNRMATGESTAEAEIKAGAITGDPDADGLLELVGLLDEFDLWFNVIEP